jgi:hypothetical protein
MEAAMSKKQMIVTFLIVSTLLAASLACNLFSDIRKVGDTANTAEAMITDADIGVETMQAAITDIGAKITESGIVETVQAVATENPIALPTGDKPEDIPIMDGNRSAEITSSNLISYIIDAAFDDVIAFYDREMVANGWKKEENDSKQNQGFASLVFEKEGRRATIIIAEVPILNQTSVSIEIK